jgi:NAD(P)-dependent dehydrogenase (short-subunit alcohol dehydrogenase family)
MPALDGKVALVTGAANGIGRATVERFRDEGATVIAVDREFVDGWANDQTGITVAVADVTDATQIAQAADLARELGGLDICVANAGVGGVEPFVDGSRASWMPIFDVNIVGVMLTLQAGARIMIEGERGGRLLATASIAGLRGEAMPSTAYAASKGAVMALMRHLALELAPHGITANAVAPGQIATALNDRDLQTLADLAGESATEMRTQMLGSTVPAGRMGRPEEVAALYAYLASEEAAFVTGSTFRIDGGELAI